MKKLLSTVLATTMLVAYAGGAYAATPNGNSSASIGISQNKIPKEFFNPNHPEAIKDPATIEKYEKILQEIEKSEVKYSVSTTAKAPQAAAAGAVVAVYFIPGIGEVALLATGAILIGTAVWYAGEWLYDVVSSWLKSETASDYIAKNRKGSILREFPSEYLDKTLDEIEADAKKGNATARKAKKLLNDRRFSKN
ncbi:hypothetical protein [Brevibacillus sp. NRS-1366]|uniref:hypothetical protein n=1 Tax=Brevibacillus sp. NRS-1366 TaxID=3233899 RepID=UPI003D21B715